MERCRLCNGRIVNGRCVDCGLDNSKSDKNYRLNVHNQKAVRMHSGDCDTHLNKDSDSSTKKQTAGSMAGSGKQAQKYSKKAEKVMIYGMPDTLPEGGARRRQLKKRHATGTVQHKKGKKWAVILLVVAVYAVPAVIEFADDHMDEIQEAVASLENGSLGDLISEIFGAEPSVEPSVDPGNEDSTQFLSGEDKVLPEKVTWNTEDPLYYEENLQDGFYTAGYDFPSGTYQITCTSGDAMLEWYDAGEEGTESGYALLLSDAWKEALELEEDEMYTEYGANTESLTLKENAMLYVNNDGDVLLEGMKADDEPLKTRQAQVGLPESVNVPVDGLESGTDFLVGVYDICYQGSGYAAVEVTYDEGNVFYMNLGENHSVICRVPFEQSGITIRLDEYDMNEGDLVLRPSW